VQADFNMIVQWCSLCIDINGTNYANWWRIVIWWHVVESEFHVLREAQISIATELKNNTYIYWFKKSIQLLMTLEWCSRKPYRDDETSTYQKYLAEVIPSHKTCLLAFSVHKQVNFINFSASSSMNINSRKLWHYRVLRPIVYQ
jgi:hypothetical protein